MKLNSKNIFEYSAVSLLGEAALTTKTEVNNYFIFSIFSFIYLATQQSTSLTTCRGWFVVDQQLGVCVGVCIVHWNVHENTVQNPAHSGRIVQPGPLF